MVRRSPRQGRRCQIAITDAAIRAASRVAWDLAGRLASAQGRTRFSVKSGRPGRERSAIRDWRLDRLFR